MPFSERHLYLKFVPEIAFLYLPWLFRANLPWLQDSAVCGSPGLGFWFVWFFFFHGCLSSPVIFNILVRSWMNFEHSSQYLITGCWLSQDSNQEAAVVIHVSVQLKLQQCKRSSSEAPRSCCHLLRLFIWKEELILHWIRAAVAQTSMPIVVWYLQIMNFQKRL